MAALVGSGQAWRRPRVETCSWTGSGAGRVNEDFACVDAGAGCAVLVDGATGLTGTNLVRGTSDAAWYARELAAGACGRMAAEPTTPVADALGAAGRAAAEAYGALPGAGSLTAADWPNGSVAAIRWTESQVELAMLGDCTAVVLLAGGGAEVVHDATLDALDQRNYELMREYALARHATMAEARVALNHRFVQNRMLVNAPGGYWAADVSCRGFGHELVRTYRTREVAGVALLTDGFAAAAEMGVAPDARELARMLACGGGQAAGEDLRRRELEDAGCWAHPRSKVSDDATYVLLLAGPPRP